MPFSLFGTVWGYLKLRDLSPRRHHVMDWWGNITFAVGLIGVLVAITYGIQPYGGHIMGWTNPWVLASMIGGVGTARGLLRRSRPGSSTRCSTSTCSGSGRSPFGNLASLLAGLGRGGLMFILIIWLQGIWLPRHGYSFESDAAVGGHLHAADDGRLPRRRAAVGLAVRPVRRPLVRHRRHADRRAELRLVRRAAGELHLLDVRGRALLSTASAWACSPRPTGPRS